MKETPANIEFNNHPARQDTSCLGCGGAKSVGPIVCWTCFKRRPDGNSLKSFMDGTDHTFSQWLTAIGRTQ